MYVCYIHIFQYLWSSGKKVMEMEMVEHKKKNKKKRSKSKKIIIDKIVCRHFNPLSVNTH